MHRWKYKLDKFAYILRIVRRVKWIRRGKINTAMIHEYKIK